MSNISSALNTLSMALSKAEGTREVGKAIGRYDMGGGRGGRAGSSDK